MLFVLFLFFQSFSCSKNDGSTQNVDNEALVVKKKKIVTYINGFNCSSGIGCKSIAFGSKPCGGPMEYLVFSNAVDLLQLQAMVAEYNQSEAAYNLQYGISSDCMVVSPPANIGCVNGQCAIVK